ncbi:MAG: lytic transglycosylase domain-containing protein, partial [Sphingomonadales bacterium]|nr:lytic transglycosylase domain-containing protein [Sphingomonadales bacterium]
MTGFGGKFRRQRAASALALLCAALPLTAIPGKALANSAAAEYFRTRADRSAVPKLLTEDERAWYRDMFASIKKSDWAHVQTLFAQKPDGPLHPVARAEYYLAAGSPRVDADSLAQILTTTPDLPEAEQLATLAQKRGVTTLPSLPQPQMLVAQRSAPRRILPRDVADGTMPANVAAAIVDRIKADDSTGARLLLDGVDAGLSPEARAQWRQRVAWSYYIENQDGDAFSLGVAAGQGAGLPVAGAWTAEGWWTAGLAATRTSACAEAANAFANAAATAQNPELAAAAHYWRSRALVRCRQPEAAAAPLRAAAAYDETLYGMLAAEQLGMKLPTTHDTPDFTPADWQNLRTVANVRAAVELAEIGEDGLADEVLRHQARIGAPGQYQPLSRLARDLGLPSTQLWMATNVPAGAAAEPAARYPTPKWTPVTGWQVDPALVYAHTLQESVFRA